MTSSITLNTHLAGVAYLQLGHLTASVLGAAFRVIAM
jgi:hypothetical protein